MQYLLTIAAIAIVLLVHSYLQYFCLHFKFFTFMEVALATYCFFLLPYQQYQHKIIVCEKPGVESYSCDICGKNSFMNKHYCIICGSRILCLFIFSCRSATIQSPFCVRQSVRQSVRPERFSEPVGVRKLKFGSNGLLKDFFFNSLFFC